MKPKNFFLYSTKILVLLVCMFAELRASAMQNEQRRVQDLIESLSTARVHRNGDPMWWHIDTQQYIETNMRALNRLLYNGIVNFRNSHAKVPDNRLGQQILKTLFIQNDSEVFDKFISAITGHKSSQILPGGRMSIKTAVYCMRDAFFDLANRQFRSYLQNYLKESFVRVFPDDAFRERFTKGTLYKNVNIELSEKEDFIEIIYQCQDEDVKRAGMPTAIGFYFSSDEDDPYPRYYVDDDSSELILWPMFPSISLYDSPTVVNYENVLPFSSVLNRVIPTWMQKTETKYLKEFVKTATPKGLEEAKKNAPDNTYKLLQMHLLMRKVLISLNDPKLQKEHIECLWQIMMEAHRTAKMANSEITDIIADLKAMNEELRRNQTLWRSPEAEIARKMLYLRIMSFPIFEKLSTYPNADIWLKALSLLHMETVSAFFNDNIPEIYEWQYVRAAVEEKFKQPGGFWSKVEPEKKSGEPEQIEKKSEPDKQTESIQKKKSDSGKKSAVSQNKKQPQKKNSKGKRKKSNQLQKSAKKKSQPNNSSQKNEQKIKTAEQKQIISDAPHAEKIGEKDQEQKLDETTQNLSELKETIEVETSDLNANIEQKSEATDANTNVSQSLTDFAKEIISEIIPIEKFEKEIQGQDVQPAQTPTETEIQKPQGNKSSEKSKKNKNGKKKKAKKKGSPKSNSVATWPNNTKDDTDEDDGFQKSTRRRSKIEPFVDIAKIFSISRKDAKTLSRVETLDKESLKSIFAKILFTFESKDNAYSTAEKMVKGDPSDSFESLPKGSLKKFCETFLVTPIKQLEKNFSSKELSIIKAVRISFYNHIEKHFSYEKTLAFVNDLNSFRSYSEDFDTGERKTNFHTCVEGVSGAEMVKKFLSKSELRINPIDGGFYIQMKENLSECAKKDLLDGVQRVNTFYYETDARGSETLKKIKYAVEDVLKDVFNWNFPFYFKLNSDKTFQNNIFAGGWFGTHYLRDPKSDGKGTNH